MGRIVLVLDIILVCKLLVQTNSTDAFHSFVWSICCNHDDGNNIFPSKQDGHMYLLSGIPLRLVTAASLL
jgi:hypothetical protein